MVKAKKKRCGMVSIIGRPNVGKSTLLNNIVGEKVAIVTRVPQTTRNQVRGIYNDERGQIVFIDTPGLHLGGDKLDKFMNQTAAGTIDDVDCLIYLVDTSRLTGPEEESIASRLKNVKTPIIYGMNKIDLKRRNVDEYIGLWERVKGKSVSEMKNFIILALAGLKGTNVEKLIDILFEYMPEGPLLYPENIAGIPKPSVKTKFAVFRPTPFIVIRVSISLGTLLSNCLIISRQIPRILRAFVL